MSKLLEYMNKYVNNMFEYKSFILRFIPEPAPKVPYPQDPGCGRGVTLDQGHISTVWSVTPPPRNYTWDHT